MGGVAFTCTEVSATPRLRFSQRQWWRSHVSSLEDELSSRICREHSWDLAKIVQDEYPESILKGGAAAALHSKYTFSSDEPVQRLLQQLGLSSVHDLDFAQPTRFCADGAALANLAGRVSQLLANQPRLFALPTPMRPTVAEGVHWPTKGRLHDPAIVSVTRSLVDLENGQNLDLLRLSVPYANLRCVRVARLHFVDIALNTAEDVLTGPAPAQLHGIRTAHRDLLVDACLRMLGPDAGWAPWHCGNMAKTMRRLSRMITLGFCYHREAFASLEHVVQATRNEVNFHARRLWRQECMAVQDDKPFYLDIPVANHPNRVLEYFVFIFMQRIWPGEIEDLSPFLFHLTAVLRNVRRLFELSPAMQGCAPC